MHINKVVDCDFPFGSLNKQGSIAVGLTVRESTDQSSSCCYFFMDTCDLMILVFFSCNYKGRHALVCQRKISGLFLQEVGA